MAADGRVKNKRLVRVMQDDLEGGEQPIPRNKAMG